MLRKTVCFVIKKQSVFFHQYILNLKGHDWFKRYSPFNIKGSFLYIFNRPVVPGLFYKHLCNYLFDLLCHHFPPDLHKTSLHPNRKSYNTKILRECSLPTMCHMSGDTCQVSCVTCQKSHVIFFIFSKVVGLVG